MKNILDLIKDSPVEWKALGEVAEVSAGNSAPQDSDLFIDGIYPFCRTSDVGKVHNSVNFSQIQDKLNDKGIKGLRLFKKETILLPKSGASTLLNHRVMLSVDSYVSSHLATIYRDENIVLARFLFYFLSQFDIGQLIPDKSYPSLKVSELAMIKIPIPPLELQQKIVKMLDKFTELEATLEAELALRVKQYHYYREHLLTFKDDEVEWKPLEKTVYSIKTGLNPRNFFQLNTNDATNYYVTIREIENHRIVFTEKTDKLNDEALVLCNNRSNLEVGDVLFSGTGTIGRVALITQKPTNWNIKEGVYAIKPIQNIILPKFLLYLFESEFIRNDFLSKSAGGTVKSVPMKELAKVQIPIPPLKTQQKIVEILDKFDTLTYSISEGLPREIELRRKQYEYYREQLLDFSKQA